MVKEIIDAGAKRIPAHSITGRFFKTLVSRYMRSNLTGRLFKHKEDVGEHLCCIAEDMGITVDKVVKRRGDTRFVVRGTCPRRGTVALKGCVPSFSPYLAVSSHANAASLQGVSALFADVYEYGLGYSVERWVEGPSLADVGIGELDDGQIDQFLDELKSWATHTDMKTRLTRVEVRYSVRWYLQKLMIGMGADKSIYSLANARYSMQTEQGRGLMDEIEERLQKLGSGLLPATLTVADLNWDNVIYDMEQDRLVIIDCEQITRGHFGFDIAWLISKLTKRGDWSVAGGFVQGAFRRDGYLNESEQVFFMSILRVFISSSILFGGGQEDEVVRTMEWLDSTCPSM